MLLFCRYEGEYVRGVKEGNGIFIYPDGSKYEGQWKAGNRCGQGKYLYANGDWYKGNWKDNLKDGKGVYYHKQTDSQFMGIDNILFYYILLKNLKTTQNPVSDPDVR